MMARKALIAAVSFALIGITAPAASEPPDPKAVKAALERHGLDPKALNANVLQAQIRKMRTQLQINCQPVRGIMSALLETAITYRESVLFELTNHAADKSAVAKAQSRFAVPPQAPGSKIPAEAVSTLRNQAHYFNEVDKLVRLALEERVLQTAKVPPGADLALLVMASGVRKSDFFFITAKKADDAGKKATIQRIAKDFAKLRASWSIERDAYQKAFTRKVFDNLNGKYDGAPADWLELREAYEASARELKRVSESNRFEHCIGQIREELKRSAVGKNAPFFNPGPQGSVDALPGMGFNLTFEPTLSPFNFVIIPREFPYQMDFKKSFQDARNLAILEIVGALEAKRDATAAAAFIFSGNFNQAFGQAVFGISDNFKNFAVSLTDGTAIAGVNQLGGKLITDLRGVGNAAVDAAVDGFEARMVAFAKLTSDVDFSLSTARQPGEGDQQYIDRLTKVLDIEAQSELLVDTASDVLILVGEAVTGNIAGSALKTALKSGSKLLDSAVSLGTGKATRQAIERIGKNVDNISIPDLRKKLAVNGRLDAIGERFIADVAKRRDGIRKEISAIKKVAREVEREQTKLSNTFGSLNGSKPKFETPGPPKSEITILGPDGKPTAGKILVGEDIKAGATSAVSFDPTDASSVLRTTDITGPGDTSVLKDEFGRRQLEALQNSGALTAGRIVKRKRVGVGNIEKRGVNGDKLSDQTAFVEQVERVPETVGDIVERQGKLTEGQEAARSKFFEQLNENGFFFSDNNSGNYSFENTGGDNWNVVVLDPGGILPAPDAATAIKLQNKLDSIADGGPVSPDDLPSIIKTIIRNRDPDALTDPVKLGEFLRTDKQGLLGGTATLGDLLMQDLVKKATDVDRLVADMTAINNSLPGAIQVTDPAALTAGNLEGLITVAKISAERNTPLGLGAPIKIQDSLDDLAAKSESLIDRTNVANAKADELQAAVGGKLTERTGAAVGTAFGGLPDGGEELGKRLQLAAAGKFNAALKSDGENDQLDPEANKRLKDLGRALLTDFTQVECAALVEKVVTTVKNDNDPNAGLEDVDQDKVDACAGVGAKKGG